MVNSLDDAMQSLCTVQDFVRWGVSQFGAAELHYGHGADNSLDEALVLVAHALWLPLPLPPEFLPAHLTLCEKQSIVDLFHRRTTERVPAAYLTKEAWFAGLKFYVDERVLIPRSPIAELIDNGFEPWIDSTQVGAILDLCTGSACIAIACSYAFPDAIVDAVDISSEALDVATLNVTHHHVAEQVRLLESDLFSALKGRRYDVIVSNPPYVGKQELESLPKEYSHEPSLGLRSGVDGLDCVIRILREARNYLSDRGILIVEVGNTQEALKKRFSNVGFTWVDFERGGDGVFLLTAQELDHYVDHWL